MSSKREQLQNAWHRYDSERKHKPSGTREVVEWAVAEGLLELPEVDPLDVLAGQMAQALRDEFGTDAREEGIALTMRCGSPRAECSTHFGP